jgi:hypothetical protein
MDDQHSHSAPNERVSTSEPEDLPGPETRDSHFLHAFIHVADGRTTIENSAPD